MPKRSGGIIGATFEHRGTASWWFNYMRPTIIFLSTLLDRTVDTGLARQRRTHIKEQESYLGARHLLQARRPAEHRLQCYVDHSSEAPRHNHLPNLRYCTVAFRETSSTAPIKHYYTASHRDAVDTLWTSGIAQTHARRFTPAKLLIEVSLLARWCVNSGKASSDVNRCSNAVFENTVFKITYSTL